MHPLFCSVHCRKHPNYPFLVTHCATMLRCWDPSLEVMLHIQIAVKPEEFKTFKTFSFCTKSSITGHICCLHTFLFFFLICCLFINPLTPYCYLIQSSLYKTTGNIQALHNKSVYNSRRKQECN